MQALFDEIENRLRAFLQQRDDAFLFVCAGPAESIAIHKTLEGLESKLGDVFWLFGPPFVEARMWVSAVVDEYCMRVDAVSQRLIYEKEQPLPVLRRDAFDPQVAPALRLRWLCEHARSLIEDLEGSRAIFGWMPATIADPMGFAGLIQDFCTQGAMAMVDREQQGLWYRHMRFIVREDAEKPILIERARAWPRTQFFAPDLGPAAIEGSLEDQANDEAKPLAIRMQALFLLAGMDVGYNRPAQAVEKFGLLAKYHRGTGNQPLYALSLNGIGEAFARAGDGVNAQLYFERALAPAVALQDAQVLATITVNLANLHYNHQRWVEAYEHYAAVGSLATAIQNPRLKIVAHQYMGVCLYQTQQWKPAHDEWRAGAVLALGMGDADAARPCLEHLRDLFGTLSLVTQKAQVQAELDNIDELAAQASKGGVA